MATSTDPYNYGQNSVEYNQNGDSYNGSMGAMSGGSIMNAGLQGGGGSSTASNNPFESFLSHAMTLSNYVNGQTPQAGSPNGGQQYQFPQYSYPAISRPGVTGTIGQPPMVGTWEDPNYDRINGPSSPSRPGVTGTIGQPPMQDKSAFTGPNGQFNTLGYYQQWLPSLTQDQLNQYWTEGAQGQSQGQTISDWYGSRFNPDGSPKQGYGNNGSTPSSTNPGNMAGQYEPNQGVTGQQPWTGAKFVQGYGWTQTPEEYQAAQNQVQNQSSGTPTPPDTTHTPVTPVAAPSAPQAGSVQDMLHKLLSPLFQQQQGDLTKQLNANAAVTGDINAGGYSTGTGPSSFNRQLSDLTAQQGSQEAGFLQQANENALQRALQEHLGELGLQGTKYSADQGLLGARAGAAATSSAATTAANASMSNAGLNYNLGLGNLDVSRENNLLGFLSSMYGMTPAMISALLAGSPESLLSGQTVPAGNIVVKP